MHIKLINTLLLLMHTDTLITPSQAHDPCKFQRLSNFLPFQE